MYIRRFGSAFCLVIEPPIVREPRNDDFEYEAEYKYEEDDDEARAADDEANRFIDRWSGADGHFLRIGRVTFIYKPRAKRQKTEAEPEPEAPPAE